MSKQKIRIDQYLLDRGEAQTLAEAAAMVMAGEVVLNEQQVKFASQMVGMGDSVRVKQRSAYVGRGGDKLKAAIDKLGVQDDFRDKTVLDVGASTGGFTDCVLQLGAKTVVAIDVGTNQLAWKIRSDARVIAHENVDMRKFDPTQYAPIHWMLVDVSFIGLVDALPPLLQKLQGQPCRFLILIKPQFELAADDIPKGGIVEDEELRKQAVNLVVTMLERYQIKVDQTIDSPVAGRQGNREIFCLAHS